MSLQEKFQITVPPKVSKEDRLEGEWKDVHTARFSGGEGFLHVNNTTSDATVRGKYNYTPPGMDISNQRRSRQNNMLLVVAGESDVSEDTNPQAFAKGFTRRAMDGTDDQYTGEHCDLFYGEAKDEDGHVGFVERNNYLDRM